MILMADSCCTTTDVILIVLLIGLMQTVVEYLIECLIEYKNKK